MQNVSIASLDGPIADLGGRMLDHRRVEADGEIREERTYLFADRLLRLVESSRNGLMTEVSSTPARALGEVVGWQSVDTIIGPDFETMTDEQKLQWITRPYKNDSLQDEFEARLKQLHYALLAEMEAN